MASQCRTTSTPPPRLRLATASEESTGAPSLGRLLFVFSCQVFTKNYCGCHGVNGRLILGRLLFLFGFISIFLAELLFEQAFCFPARQPLVHHLDGDANLLPRALGKS